MNDIKEKEQLPIVPLGTSLMSCESGRTYSQNGTYVTFPLIFWAIFSHTRLKKRHASKKGMNRIKENLLLPIVLQATQVPLGS
jgi:hypothetical protein